MSTGTIPDIRGRLAVNAENEVTLEDIAAVEKILKHIDHQNTKRTLLEPLANWKLGLKIFKDFELRYTCMADRSQLEKGHRAILTALMAVTECLNTASEDLTDEDLKGIRLTKKAIDSNARYLRTKFQQWYGLRDQALLDTTSKAIEDAGEGTGADMSKDSAKINRLVHRLAALADAARNRVSGYSDEQRSQLETTARGIIKGAHAKQVCRH